VAGDAKRGSPDARRVSLFVVASADLPAPAEWNGPVLHAANTAQMVQQILDALTPQDRIGVLFVWGHGSPLVAEGGRQDIGTDSYLPDGQVLSTVKRPQGPGVEAQWLRLAPYVDARTVVVFSGCRVGENPALLRRMSLLVGATFMGAKPIQWASGDVMKPVAEALGIIDGELEGSRVRCLVGSCEVESKPLADLYYNQIWLLSGIADYAQSGVSQWQTGVAGLRAFARRVSALLH